MARALIVVFVTLGVIQTLWGSAYSSLLGPTINTVDAAPQVGRNEYCHTCVNIEDLCYNHTYLLELKAPFGARPIVRRMGIAHSNNMLFYTFEPKFEDTEYSKVAYVNLVKNDVYFGLVKGRLTYNFDAFDINQNEKLVYLAGTDGIWYVRSTNTHSRRKNPRYYLEKSKIITNIVAKDYVYYTEDYQPGIKKVKDGNLTSISILLKDTTIKAFVLDKDVDYNVVYLNDTGLFISFHSNTPTDPVRLSPDTAFRGLIVDTKGRVFAFGDDGIYKVILGKVRSESTLRRVSGIVPEAMTFDGYNNIIYSIRNKLYKLTKVNTEFCFW